MNQLLATVILLVRVKHILFQLVSSSSILLTTLDELFQKFGSLQHWILCQSFIPHSNLQLVSIISFQCRVIDWLKGDWLSLGKKSAKIKPFSHTLCLFAGNEEPKKVQYHIEIWHLGVSILLRLPLNQSNKSDNFPRLCAHHIYSKNVKYLLCC